MRVLQMVVALFALTAFASSAASEESDLVGVWKAKVIVALQSDGKIVETPRVMSITIEQVNGSLLRGERTWSAESDVTGNVAGEDVLEASEPFIGAVEADGKTIHLVEVDDNGMMFCELLGPNELELTYMETDGNPVVYTAIFRRE